jgi:hypothetical protein
LASNRTNRQKHPGSSKTWNQESKGRPVKATTGL